MSSSIYAPQPLEMVVNRILATRQLTRCDEQQLHQAMVSNGFLSSADLEQISTILHCLKSRLIQVVE